jgi:hypothetical protein
MELPIINQGEEIAQPIVLSDAQRRVLSALQKGVKDALAKVHSSRMTNDLSVRQLGIIAFKNNVSAFVEFFAAVV